VDRADREHDGRDRTVALFDRDELARIAGGWRVLEDMFEDGFYFGPEVHHFGQDGYRHTRFGAHFTGLKAENYEWSAAAGWAHDSDRTSGPYVRLNISTRR
jgi:hypothetical protein